ncbi:MAG: hypothetical protein PHN47_03795 [Clostridia bacterium]|jgi:hypothetical protein|nr:hypothetical protein [Clostridia bacterium]
MKKTFNYKNFIINWVVLAFVLGIFILIHLNADPNNISPTVGYYLSPILYILIGIFFNQSKLVSLFQQGQLIIRLDYLVMSIVFLMLLLMFIPAHSLNFTIPVLARFLRSTHLGYDLLGPILLFAPKLIPLFFGYFAAGIFYKVKE